MNDAGRSIRCRRSKRLPRPKLAFQPTCALLEADPNGIGQRIRISAAGACLIAADLSVDYPDLALLDEIAVTRLELLKEYAPAGAARSCW